MLLRQVLQLRVLHMNESLSISFLQPILTLANCLKVIFIGPGSGSAEIKCLNKTHTELVLWQSEIRGS